MQPTRIWRRFASATQWVFGLCCVMGVLAVLATIPVVQILSLGYLLEVTGRIARSGCIRDGFVGVRKAAQVGSLVVGAWLCLQPLRFVSEMWNSARLIDPESTVTQNWRRALVVLTVLMACHILWAWARGGKLRHFLWPAPIRFFKALATPNKIATARDAVWDYVISLRLGHYAWLGLRGFVGAMIWLALPVSMLAIASRLPPIVGVLCGLLGGLLMMITIAYLPFLQANFAAENRFAAMFDLSAAHRVYNRAPIACWLGLLATLAFALPLYLLKIELTPREVAWLPALAFVLFMFPARLLVGWAVGRARRREQPRFFLFGWIAYLAAGPLLAFYVFITYFTQYLSWYGVWSLYEQHAFLLPAPFLGM